MLRQISLVEQTKDGKLAKDVREALLRLEGILGFRVKVVEKAGAPLKRLFTNTNPWAGGHCSQNECLTCNQGAEELPNCTKRSLVYENICLKCNPDASKKGELKTLNTTTPSIYVGETSRSVQERALEHHAALKNKSENSHMYKHWLLHHPGEEEPKFIMKVVQFHGTALSRQVGEAVRIARRGRDTPLLNSRGEYNRCSIVRLSLDQADVDSFEGTEQGELEGEENLNEDWTAGLLEGRDNRDRAERKSMKRIEKTDSSKRERGAEMPPKRRKKLKYDLGGEEWGQTGGREGGKTTFLYSGLEGVKKEGGSGKTGGKTGESVLCVLKNSETMMTTWLDRLAEPSVCNVKNKSSEGVSKNPRTNRKEKKWTKLKNGLFGWRISRSMTNNHLTSQTEQCADQGSPSARAKNLVQVSSSYTSNKRKISLGGGDKESGEIKSESFAGCRGIKKKKTKRINKFLDLPKIVSVIHFCLAC